jgi:chromosome segregation ATPase
MDKAADEITLLTAERDEWKARCASLDASYKTTFDERKALFASRDYLTARVKELGAMLRTASDMNEVYEGRLQELEGENKNLKLMVDVLRKALKENPND